MEFEWDPKKTRLNQKKHGISFSEAVEIWQGVCLSVENIARTKEGEYRNATIGASKGKLYTAIWTSRGSRIRLVSVRRARNGEKEAYWQNV